jgi:polar amino acid transport system substrate-binding protein/glutamate/aspartate transport system substrate-binding protein
MLVLIIGTLAPAEAAVLDRVRETGSPRLGYRVDTEPFSYNDPSGQPAGYSVELCKAVAEAVRQATGRSDLRLDWREVTAADRFTMLARGEVDLLCSADTVTLSRREQVAFSALTFVTGATLLYHTDGPASVPELAGQKVGVRAGTTTEAGLRKGLADAGIAAEVVAVASHEEGVRRLAAGEFAAYFGDASILIFQIAKSPDRERLKLATKPLSFEPYALPLPRGDEDSRLLVDRTLARLYGSGEIERVFTAVFRAEARPPEFLRALYVLNAPPE